MTPKDAAQEILEEIDTGVGCPAVVRMNYSAAIRRIAEALAQAHAEGRAEALEEAARLFDAKAAELRKSNYPPTHLAAYEHDDHADRIRALAGQPSGDAT